MPHMAAGPAQTDSWHCHTQFACEVDAEQPETAALLKDGSSNGQHMPLYDLTMVITVFPLQFPNSFLGWNTNLLRSDYAQIKLRL